MNRDPPRDVRATQDIFDACNLVLDSLVVLYRAVRRSRRAPVRIGVFMPTLSRSANVPLVMRDDQPATAAVVFNDAFGEVTAAPGPVSWVISDPAVASATPSADGLSAVITALAGDGRFTVQVSSGDLSGESDQIEIDPGAAVSEAISITMTPNEPAPAA